MESLSISKRVNWTTLIYASYANKFKQTVTFLCLHIFYSFLVQSGYHKYQHSIVLVITAICSFYFTVSLSFSITHSCLLKRTNILQLNDIYACCYMIELKLFEHHIHSFPPSFIYPFVLLMWTRLDTFDFNHYSL